FHERLAIPFACLSLGLLAVPLGLQSRATARTKSRGIILGVLAFLSYYLLYSGVRGLGDKGLLPPWAALWLPNVLFVCLTVYLTIRTANERSWALFDPWSWLKQRGPKGT
ncbi:MAG: LptF/LptG family permease, partial [Deltaproteobacteria bacterium]|nr:LptF/LptG family permease [Deltaproteobacteria bacterium]